MKYKCWMNDPDDAADVKAIDPEDAASSYAKQQCEDDCDYYAEYDDGGGIVNVRDPDGAVHVCRVSINRDPTFYAKEIKL